ncbi:hypothetical protein [Halapricum desulfuricans]|uniref:Zn finger domain containing protein n=1 Tax=Halapricum desulfuricans TaxID=2841257 RepID=A0A897N2T3_9EURY|nr:hypothetical protein [Halapricum desulfuricans]QSG06801.1 Zn finger domain containing protein [Halapricum desulfuricans]
MDCSRCGGDLEVYSLGEQEAYVCADCGFVDTTVEHEVKTRPEPEPWERALERFYRKHTDDTEAAVVGSGETAALVEIEPDSDDSAVEASAAAETAADAQTEPDVEEAEPDDEPTDVEEAEPDDEPAAEQPQ